MVECNRPIEILLVEDNPGDVRLTREALKDGKVSATCTSCKDGVEAMDFLRRQGKYADAPRPRPHPARPQPAAEGRARGAGGDQGRRRR